jgi:hypothetical protein
LVHNSCRKHFTDSHGKRGVDDFGDEQERDKKLRTNVDTVFAWKAMRVFVVKEIDEEQHCKVQMLKLQQTQLKHCKLRGEDVWPIAVNGRLDVCNDLIAEEACCYVYCHNRFTRRKKLTADGIAGRLENHLLSGFFDSLCQWLESCSYEQLHTLDELRM